MAEKIIARQTYDGLWQWRNATVDGEWLSEEYFTGDDEALAEQAKDSHASVTLLLPGESVMACETEIDAKDKRHLAKLLPYELEEQIIDNVEDVHFAFGAARDNKVPVIYSTLNEVESAIKPLMDLHCDLREILPDYLSLRTENNGATIVIDSGQIIGRLADNSGFAVDISLAQLVLSDQDELDFASTVNIVAASETQLDWLEDWLPASWKEEDGPEIKRHIGGIWDWVEPRKINTELNMRRGTFSRQLPIKRWFDTWKKPLIAVGVAYLIAVGITFVQYQQAKAEQKQIAATMNEIYKKAVPNGRAGDPEGRLKRMVEGLGGGSGSTASSNLLILLSAFAETMKSSDSISIASFRYNADSRELLLNIEAGSFGDLETLRTGVEKKGFAAELMRVEAKGDKQSARMKVSEAQS